ncbi:MAG: nuclear transport factor 2 family protein [Gemmatimonadetes bacterium]|nr:nuclear transport factor 2 family protein [Gemmatimonadota bacterium]
MRLLSETSCVVFCLALLLTGAPSEGQAQTAETEIRSAIHAFHAALAAGDSTTALALLADDVVILESGNVEDKAHYRSGHLAGDMRFAQAVPADRGEITVRSVGDVAWAWSTSTREGRMGERQVSSRGAELMVLRRLDGAWRITAIHWSSRSR